MGVSAAWTDDSHRIFQFVFEHPWTWEEYYALLEWALPEIKAAGHPVATILEVSKMRSFPPGNVVTHLTGIGRRMPSNIFTSVIVSPPQIATLFMDILTKINPDFERFNHFDRSLEGAHRYISEQYQIQFQNGSDQSSV